MQLDLGGYTWSILDECLSVSKEILILNVQSATTNIQASGRIRKKIAAESIVAWHVMVSSAERKLPALFAARKFLPVLTKKPAAERAQTHTEPELSIKFTNLVRIS